MENIPSVISLFSEAAFPIAVAAFLLISTTKQLNALKTNQLKQMIMLALLLQKNGQVIPDTKLAEIVKLLMTED